MDVLGWRILGNGEYIVDFPILSDEEETLISSLEDRFKETTRTLDIRTAEEKEACIEHTLLSAAEDSEIYLSRSQQEYLSRVAASHIYGFAFMEPLIEDAAIEEISVIGPLKPIYVYLRNKGWKKVNACFETDAALADMINRMARSLGRHITIQNPRLDAMLPDGSRLHASLPPISLGEITIRKFRDKPFSPRELSEYGTISIDALALLSIIMQCDSSMVIAGNTASGKTTTMNALFSFIPANERVLITEETPEINIPHKHCVRLVANRDLGISLKDLVYDTLRMRPDRMIVGEVRNKEEVEALFDVLLAGQARGSYATMHAQSVEEALSRLRTFGVNENDLKSIDCILVQRRMLSYDPETRTNKEVRKVVQIAEIGDSARIIYSNGRMADSSILLEKAAEAFGINENQMTLELEKRKKAISESGPGYLEFYNQIQKHFYGVPEVGVEDD